MTVNELLTRSERWLTKFSSLEDSLQRDKSALEKLRILILDLKSCIALLQHIASETSKAREEEIASLASLALKETFFDQDLTLIVEHEVYRGQPGVVFKLRDMKVGIEGDPMDSFGGGPASLLGLVLQTISVSRQPGMSKILILDEPFVQVSEAYQEQAGKILRRLCEPPPKGAGFKMLVVTHSQYVALAAHKRYVATKSDNGKSLILTEVNLKPDSFNYED